jgi:hypothetical protein
MEDLSFAYQLLRLPEKISESMYVVIVGGGEC